MCNARKSTVTYFLMPNQAFGSMHEWIHSMTIIISGTVAVTQATLAVDLIPLLNDAIKNNHVAL